MESDIIKHVSVYMYYIHTTFTFLRMLLIDGNKCLFENGQQSPDKMLLKFYYFPVQEHDLTIE